MILSHAALLSLLIISIRLTAKNMLGNITVGIVIVLAVAACGLGVWLDRAKSDSQDNNTDAQPKN